MYYVIKWFRLRRKTSLSFQLNNNNDNNNNFFNLKKNDFLLLEKSSGELLYFK